jgi:hypothetical protein
VSAELDRAVQGVPPVPPYRCTAAKTRARERTEVLERRLAHLRARIREHRCGSGHYDRAEAAALAWAIGLARAEVKRLAEALSAELDSRRAEGGVS